jgi:regulator of sirC expression with transglutaminase-like and TPR domain
MSSPESSVLSPLEIGSASASELRSLLALLDDPDPKVASVVEDRLRCCGPSIMCPLLDFAATSGDELAKLRAESIVHDINVEKLIEEFTALRQRIEHRERGTLEDGAFLIARYGAPSLDVEYYKAELDALAGMLHDRIRGIHSPVEVLAETNDFFFRLRGFRGNHQTFLDPDNSYINQVLDRRLGIPISLATIYILVAGKRLGLPFTGASTPGHFLVRYDGVRSEPLFVDAFNGGIVLKREDIRKFLYSSGIPYHESFVFPAPPVAILLRMIRNLIILFQEKKDEASRRAFERFHAILVGKEFTGTFLPGAEEH